MEKTGVRELVSDEHFRLYARSLRRRETINFFRILAVDGYEIRHSNFLGWLLDPAASHNLGAAFLEALLKRVLQEKNQFDEKLLKHTVVYREKDHLDILLINDRLSLLICIENKVGSPEGYRQLRHYRENIERDYARFRSKLLIYLTLPNSAPGSDGSKWARLSYADIAVILRQLKSRTRNRLVLTIIDMYLDTLDDLLADSLGGGSVAYEVYNAHQKTIRQIAKGIVPAPSLSGAEKKALHALINMVERDDESLLNDIVHYLHQKKGVEVSKRLNAIYLNTGSLRSLRKAIGLDGYLLYCFVAFPHAIVFQMYLHPATKDNRRRWNALREWLVANPVTRQQFQNKFGYFTFYEEELFDLTTSVRLERQQIVNRLQKKCDFVFAETIPKLEGHIAKYLELKRGRVSRRKRHIKTSR